jgi:hypothetical protein
MSTLLLLSISAFLPLLLWEFILVYGCRIPFIDDVSPFVDYGASYKWKMRMETPEKALMFACLLLFFMMVSCFYLEITQDRKQRLLAFFDGKFKNVHSSNVWRFLFLWLKKV